jgi:hypothetical protein
MCAYTRVASGCRLRRTAFAPAWKRFTDRTPWLRRAARDAEALSRNPAIRISNRDLAAIVQTSCLRRRKGGSDHSCPTAVADQCEMPRAGCTVRQQPMPAVTGSPLADVLFRRSHATSQQPCPLQCAALPTSDRSRRFDINHPTLAQSFPSAV